MRVLLVVNPASRRGAGEASVAIDAFMRERVVAEVVYTEAPGHGAEVARLAADAVDAIFTLGGDGTAMEVVDALIGRSVPVGILPGGTGNLLARALGIPRSVGAAVSALVLGRVRRIDLGRLGDGRHFAVATGVGIDTAMIQGASSEARRRFGVLAYVRSATAAILARETFLVRATVDGRVIEVEHCVSAMVANVGRVLDGALLLGPGITPDDGALDLCVLSARSHRDVAAVLSRMASRRFFGDPRLIFARGATISVEATPERVSEADGEARPRGPIHATVVPQAAPLLVPRSARA